MYISVCLHSVKAILCFMGQRVKALSPNSRLSRVAKFTVELSFLVNKNSAAKELSVHKVSKSLEIRTVWTKQHYHWT